MIGMIRNPREGIQEIQGQLAIPFVNMLGRSPRGNAECDIQVDDKFLRDLALERTVRAHVIL